MTRRFRIVTAMVLGAFLAVAALMGAGRLLASTLATGDVPQIVNYQGYLTDSGGNPISSTVTLQFSIWDASSGGNQLWSETHNNVQVSGGYFSVFLGSQGSPLTPSVFNSATRYLEVTYNAATFARQRFASVPYALVAQQAAEAITATYATTATYALNAPGGSGSVAWSHVVVVAKSGGDYTSLVDAMNAITPTASERYLVLMMPGIYEEQVTLDPYVHLKGAGVFNTLIGSSANTNNFNDNAAATMIVPANSQVSDLRIGNNSTSDDGVALKVIGGNENTVLNNVHIVTNGSGGDQHIGLYLSSGTPILNHVHIEVDGGASNNWGIFNSAASPTLRDSTIDATGANPAGLRINGGGPTIMNSTISATNGSTGEGINTSGGGLNVYIDRSTIVGDLAGGNSIISTDAINFFIGTTLLKGPVLVADPNRITCIYDYDENYLGLNADCQ